MNNREGAIRCPKEKEKEKRRKSRINVQQHSYEKQSLTYLGLFESFT